MLPNKTTLKDVINHHQPLCLSPHDTAEKAITEMEAHKRRAVAIIQDGRLAGIFTQGDFIRCVIRQDRHPRRVRLEDVMTAEPYCLHESTKIHKASKEMLRRGISHITVTDKSGRFLGILSEKDLQNTLIKTLKEYKYGYKALRTYICGEPYALCAGY